MPFAVGLKLIGIDALAPGANGPKEPPATLNGAIETVDQVPLRGPRPRFLIGRLTGVVCPAGPVMANERGTDSLPASPTPLTTMPIVGSVGSLLPISTDPESLSASGLNVTVSYCELPGAMLKVGGFTLNTDAPAGG